MTVQFFCPLWGSADLELEEFLGKAKDAGYDGVEMSLPLEKREHRKIRKQIDKGGLLFLGQHYETVTSDLAAHKEEYERHLRKLASAEPVLINTQTGRDFFSFEQNRELIEIAARVEAETKVKIYHETHRGKFSFAPHVTRRFVEALPDLRLSIDLSHWCVVAESLLEDQEETVDLVLSRADHIHARVGFAEGPQIPDPRVPEWKETVDRHIGWWDRVIARARKEGRETFTITPEFGPVPYMPTLPYTHMPVASQWDINVYMMNMLRERYGSTS